jgi:uncharacterized protein involved in exopolysaccharide biosynthesis
MKVVSDPQRTDGAPAEAHHDKHPLFERLERAETWVSLLALVLVAAFVAAILYGFMTPSGPPSWVE